MHGIDFELSGLPEVSTLNVNYGLRAVAGLTTLKVKDEPLDQAHIDLAGDLFLQMYTDEVSPKDTPPPSRELNSHLMDFLRSSDGYEESLVSTRNNLPASIFSSSMMWLHLSQDENIQLALRRQKLADQLHREADQESLQADAMKVAADASGDGDLLAQANDLMKLATTKKESAQKWSQEAVDTAEETINSEYKQAGVSSALAEAKEQANELAQAAAGWGIGRGDPIYQDPQAALRFLEANQGFVKKIAKLAGRMRGFALQGRASRPMQRGLVPVDVDNTRHIARILPSELLRLHPSQPDPIRLEAVEQLSNTGLLGMVPNEDKEELGPFVAAVDVSPSMRGERATIAKALSLGVGMTAKLDNREYALFDFASYSHGMMTVTSNDSIAKHIEWAGHQTRGGTDFDMAINYAMKLIDGLKSSDNADLLLFSDGEATVSERTWAKWAKFKRKTGARLFYVPIGKSYYPDIENMADRVYPLEEIENDTGVDLAKELGAWIR